MALEPASEHRSLVEKFQSKHRTGLVTLVFTDLVDSVALRRQLGDQAGTSLLQGHRQLVRQILGRFPDAEEIETAGDSFLLLFARPSDAVKFSLIVQMQTRALARERQVPLTERIGIHVGEVVIEKHEHGPKAKDLYGSQIDLCARVMGLAEGGQILLTRAVFDSARQALKGEEIEGAGELSWFNYGPYLLKGIEDSVDVCEVGEVGIAPLKAPAGSEKAQRQVSPDSEPVLGWRPALDQIVPHTQWVLEKKLGEGGFGEVWLGRHQKLKERRVFKFCFRADRVRSLKREMTLFRLLKERVGDHPNIVRLLEVYFDEPPFYVVMDHVDGQDLKAWCEQQGGVEKVPLEARLEIVAQIADALQAAHDAGVIHRDVKPGNILVSNPKSEVRNPKLLGVPPSGGQALESSGRVETEDAVPAKAGTPNEASADECQRLRVQAKLTDFGIGQVVSEEALKGMTKAGFTQTIVAEYSSSQTGSQMYMAPELLAGKPASPRSDIYSLGVVLYQLLVGDFSRPVTTDWADEISDPLLRDDLKHCFAGNPQERFPGAGQLAKNLRSLSARRTALGAQQAEQAAREKAAYRRGMLRTAIFATLIVILMSLLAFYGLQQARLASHHANDSLVNARAAQKNELRALQNLYAADMILAVQAVKSQDLGRALELLDRNRPTAGGPDLRGWEWRYLWRLCRSDALFSLAGHSNAVWDICFSPDGRLLASASHDKTVRLWNIDSQKQIEILQHPERAEAVAWSPNGLWIATGSDDGIIRLWDGVTRHFTLALTNGFALTRLVFSPDGKILAGASFENVRLWDFTTKREIVSLPLTLSSLTPIGLTFSSDSKQLAYDIGNGTLVLWDVRAQSHLGMFKGHADHISSFAIPKQGNTLVSAGWDNTIKIWDFAQRRVTHTLTNHIGRVTEVAFSPDEKILASASSDQRVKLWNTTAWAEVASLKGHSNTIFALAFSPDGKTVATGSKDETIKFWNASPKAEEKNFIQFPPGLNYFALSADGRTLVCLSRNNDFSLWSTSALREIARHKLPASNIVDIAISADGKAVATGDDKGKITLWDSTTMRELAVFQINAGLGRLRFSPDGKKLSAVSTNQTIHVWELGTRLEVARFTDDLKRVMAFSWSPDSRFLVTGYYEGEAKLWSISEKRQVAVFTGHKSTTIGVALAPNGRTLATASYDGTVKLWDTASREMLASLKGRLIGVYEVAISPDGKRVAAGTGEGQVKLWDLATKQEVATLEGHRAGLGIGVLSFLPDGDTLVSVRGDGMFFWRAASPGEIALPTKSAAKDK